MTNLEPVLRGRETANCAERERQAHWTILTGVLTLACIRDEGVTTRKDLSVLGVYNRSRTLVAVSQGGEWVRVLHARGNARREKRP